MDRSSCVEHWNNIKWNTTQQRYKRHACFCNLMRYFVVSLHTGHKEKIMVRKTNPKKYYPYFEVFRKIFMGFKWGKNTEEKKILFSILSRTFHFGSTFFFGSDRQNISFQGFPTFTRTKESFTWSRTIIIHSVLWKHISPFIPVKLLINQWNDQMCVRACQQYAWQIVDLWSATNLKRDKLTTNSNQNPVKMNISIKLWIFTLKMENFGMSSSDIPSSDRKSSLF